MQRSRLVRVGLPMLAAVATSITFAVAPGLARAAGGGGLVYTMSNAAAGNSVIAYTRGSDGTLTANGTYATGGTGTGVPRLGSQGSVVLTAGNKLLLVANPGSDDVSVFAVAADGTLTLTDREPSSGDRPESIAVRGSLVYVLNTGSPNNISGYTLDSAGNLTRLKGSIRSLSQEGALPAEVQFSPDGRTLVVTERNTSRIDTFRVNPTGRPTDAMPHDGSGVGPFGFAFRSDGLFVVTESFNGVDGAAAASSYTLNGGFRTVSGTVGDTQSDVCWAAFSKDQRYVYITNNGSGTISSYTVAADGSIALFQAVAGVTGAPGGFGTRDLDFTDDFAYVYAIDVGTLTVNAFRANADGTLTKLAAYGGLPSTFAGLAAS
ncbi:MAG: beta-propeller fold lactonase family protein [Solirubrobacterales bacterium]|nr:beta-propeller fold lactonase family protein [Solirubrobacterales bacterium]